MDKTSLKDVWKCVKLESGRRSVIDCGAIERQGLYAGNLDSLEFQNQIVGLYTCIQTRFHANNTIARREINIDAFGEGSGGIVEVEWYCLGTETILLDCPTNPTRGCDHSRDAGVYCFGKIPINIS